MKTNFCRNRFYISSWTILLQLVLVVAQAATLTAANFFKHHQFSFKLALITSNYFHLLNTKIFRNYQWKLFKGYVPCIISSSLREFQKLNYKQFTLLLAKQEVTVNSCNLQIVDFNIIWLTLTRYIHCFCHPERFF